MGLVNGWAIGVGLAAAGLPVLVHFLTRPRPVRLPLSTIRFVRQALQERRAVHRLRDLLVLLLRTAALLLLALAIARPLGDRRTLVANPTPGQKARVVVVDISQSMAAGQHGIAGIERARALANGYIGFEPGLRVNLILAAARPHPVFPQPSSNFSALHEDLARAKVRPERLDVRAALDAAGRMLAEAPEERRELVVVSDFQRTNWASADFTPLPEGTSIQLDSVVASQSLPNLAVLAVRSQGRVEEGRRTRIEVEIGNYSPATRNVAAELVLGGTTYRLAGSCPPRVASTLSTDVVLKPAGWLAGQARLLGAEDLLPDDDVLPLVVRVAPAPTYGLVTQEPANVRPSASYYLERALAPFTPEEPGHGGLSRSTERVVRIDPIRLDRESLGAANPVVLVRVGKLAEPAIDLLANLLRRGRGILYVASEPVDATNLHRLAEVLGSELELPVEFQPPPTGARRRDLFLTRVDATRSPFQALGQDTMAVLGPLRFSGGLSSRRRPTGLADDELASYSDRSACLVVTDCGTGRLAVLNTDLGASDLPASPAFVPVLGELAERLLGEEGLRSPRPSGEPAVEFLPAEAGTVADSKIVGPAGHASATDADPQSGRADLGELIDEPAGVVWRWPAVGPPGVYEVQRAGTTVFALASAAPPIESDLATLEPAVFENRLAGGRAVRFRSFGSDSDEQDTLWSTLAVACVLLWCAEICVLRLFRS